MKGRVEWRYRGWILEGFLSWRTLLIGVAWGSEWFPFVYVHVGPLKLGAFRDDRRW